MPSEESQEAPDPKKIDPELVARDAAERAAETAVEPKAAKDAAARREEAKRLADEAKRLEEAHRGKPVATTGLQAGDENTMSVGVKAALVTAIASIIVAVISGLFAISANNNQIDLAKKANDAQSAANNANQQLTQVAASSVGPLEQGQKLCRVNHKTWWEGLVVPKNWGVNLCSDYSKKTGGSGYQLGCIYQDGTNLAKPDGSFPSPNCGWN